MLGSVSTDRSQVFTVHFDVQLESRREILCLAKSCHVSPPARATIHSFSLCLTIPVCLVVPPSKKALDFVL